MRIEQAHDEIVFGTKEVDFYVPLRISYKENDQEGKELLYYQCLNKYASLIEISINSATKRIVEITLVTVNDETEINNSLLNELKVPCLEGNPIVDTTCFDKEHVVTDRKNYNIFRAKKKIYAMQADGIVEHKMRIDDVELLLDNENNVVGYIFDGFSNDEWDEINESIDNSLKTAASN